ncbi:hypothetical protein FQN55_001518 [Onygenales sp. PD_40]|nr:hypothetical protein FQN55_001518 [Onygenales sp. PD_40]KAK2785081.1 hypothetical protein FQN53_007974 [Emmonsiellopsis sp. PD_33]
MESAGSNGPLKVLVVGAGIGGLTVAIGLRAQGHHVIVFEQSKFANETGAAIHLAPNCNGILRRFGIYAESIGANSFNTVASFDPSGELVHEIDLKGPNSEWQHPYHFVHRRELHNALKNKATEQTGKGIPVTLQLSSRVIDIGCDDEVFVKMENGGIYTGDIVIGADGVHSKTRDVITGGTVKPFDSGKSAFRFLISRQILLDDPITREYVERENCLSMFFGNDRRLVVYPCQDSAVLNFVGIHPSKESQRMFEDWNAQGSRELLSDVYKGFGEPVLAMLSKVDSVALKAWTLLDMEALPRWTKGNLALMGDAAHPFLPHQGQGGGVAIEDAASLAVLLHEGISRKDIPERLKLYEKCRIDRAHRIQEYTRLAGRDLDEVKRSGKPLDMMEYTNFNLGHDEWDHTTQALRKWLWAGNPKLCWRMPLSFGPATGPRQDSAGRFRDSYSCTSVTASIKFKTSRTLLQNMLPTPEFAFRSPSTIAYATVSCTTLSDLDWLGGGGYSHLGLYLHGVQYTQQDGSVVNGSYLAVLFEDLADPIITGRDELGMPKVFSTINIDRQKEKLQVSLEWRGAKFGEFEWEELEQVITPSSDAADGGAAGPHNDSAFIPGINTSKLVDDGILTYRYIPAIGDPGKAESEYAVFIPNNKGVSTAPPPQETVSRVAKGRISFNPHDWNALPTLHNVASRLAEMPVYKIEEAKVVESRGIVDALRPQRLH